MIPVFGKFTNINSSPFHIDLNRWPLFHFTGYFSWCVVMDWFVNLDIVNGFLWCCVDVECSLVGWTFGFWIRSPTNRMPSCAGGGVPFCLAIFAIALPPFSICTSCWPSCARLAMPSISTLFTIIVHFLLIVLKTLFKSISARTSVVSNDSCGLVVEFPK